MNVSDLITALLDQKKELELDRRNCFNMEKRRILAIRIYQLGRTMDSVNELLDAGVMEIKMP